MIPNAEDYAFRFLGTTDKNQIELLSFIMKEYARQVLDHAAEKARTSNLPYSSILKIKDEL